MSQESPFAPVEWGQLERIRQAERRTFGIRWWVIAVAVLLCMIAGGVDMYIGNVGEGSALAVTTSLLPSLGVLLFLLIVAGVNPLLRLSRLVRPFNRAELLALFAALFVTAGISSQGLATRFVPMIVLPADPRWSTPEGGLTEDVVPYLRKELYVTDTRRIDDYRDGFRETGARAKGFLPRAEQEWNRVKDVVGRIDWAAWARPLAYWMLFVVSVYGIFLALALLLYDFWSRRERLVFPLAQIPEALVPDEGQEAGAISSTLRDRGFLIAFAAVFLLLSYNRLAWFGWLPGLHPISLGIGQSELRGLLANSVFKGIADTTGWDQEMIGLSVRVSFVAIGIGYLLPLGISFSVWTYHLICLGLYMGAIWLGFAAAVSSFPTVIHQAKNNFVTAISSGAFLAFAAVCVLKVFHDRWLREREHLAASGEGAPLLALRRTVGASGLLLLASATAAVTWLYWAGAGFSWSAGFICFAVLCTVGVMGLVAETGAFQICLHTGPLPFASAWGFLKAIPAATAVPVCLSFLGMFFFTNFSIAPALATALKMEEGARCARQRVFRALIAVAVTVMILFAFTLFLYLTHSRGANYSSSETQLGYQVDLISQLGSIGDKANDQPRDWAWVFYLIGGAWFVLSVVIRRRIFWWLHPIGLAAQVNPFMVNLWFGFFLGWLCKRLAVGYGGRHLFARIRPFFIGLIVAELVGTCVWNMVTFWGPGLR